MNAAVKRFDRFCEYYSKRNGLQNEIARELVSAAGFKARKILDLGSGEGAVFRAVNWDYESFFALDLSPSMLEIHPSGEKIVKIRADFNDLEDINNLRRLAPFDLVISSCALQWANNLEALLAAIAPMAKQAAFAIFTDGTFSDLREFSKQENTLPQSGGAKRAINKFFNAETYEKEFIINFENKRDLFKYIRESGIGGGNKKLNVSETKKLINDYPLDFLKYETLFAVARSTK